MAVSGSTNERLPTINVAAIFKRQNEILEDPVIINTLGTSLSGDRFEDFVAAVYSHFPKATSLQYLRESLMPLLGQEVTSADLQMAAWRLSANAKRLQGGPVYAWRGQTSHEWVPVHILSVDKKYNHKGLPGAIVECVILAGTPASRMMYKFWTKKFAHALGQRFGFSAPWGEYPLRDMLQLCNLKCFVRIAPELCLDKPDFDKISASSSQIQANRDILRMRNRRDPKGFQCPQNFGPNILCQNCVFGLDQCPAATHPETFTREYCTSCHKDSWLDPFHPRRKVCVPCWQMKMAKESRNKTTH